MASLESVRGCGVHFLLHPTPSIPHFPTRLGRCLLQPLRGAVHILRPTAAKFGVQPWLLRSASIGVSRKGLSGFPQRTGDVFADLLDREGVELGLKRRFSLAVLLQLVVRPCESSLEFWAGEGPD